MEVELTNNVWYITSAMEKSEQNNGRFIWSGSS